MGLGGRIALGAWVDLSVEGERTTQGGGAEHQVALYGHLGWEPAAKPLPRLRKGDACVALPPPFQDDAPGPAPPDHVPGRLSPSPRSLSLSKRAQDPLNVSLTYQFAYQIAGQNVAPGASRGYAK